MTKSHNPQPKHIKPLIVALSSLFFTSFSLFSGICTPVYAAQTTTTNQPTTIPTAGTATTTTTTATKTNPAATNAATTTTTPQAKENIITNPSTSLNQPNMPDNALLDWATDAARSAYSYDFKNFAKQLQNNHGNFTSAGWIAFMTALNKSNNLEIVQNKKLVASASLNGVPTIQKKGVKNGVYFWRIQIPLLATYESETRLIKQNLLVNMLVIRTSSPNGVGISHFVANVIPASQPITTAPTTTTGVSSATTTTTTPATTTTGGITYPATSTGTTNVNSTTGVGGTITPTTPNAPTVVPGTGTTNVTNPVPAITPSTAPAPTVPSTTGTTAPTMGTPTTSPGINQPAGGTITPTISTPTTPGTGTSP